jgi:hypothetical protein
MNSKKSADPSAPCPLKVCARTLAMIRLELLKRRGDADRFADFLLAQVLCGRSANTPVAHRQSENVRQRRDVEIAGGGSELVSRQPNIGVTRPDLAELRGEATARPVALDPADDEALSFDRLRHLVLDRLQVAVAQVGQRELP